MLKRVILIGQCGNDAVYLDTKGQRFYKKAKNGSMNMRQGRNSVLYALLVLIVYRVLRAVGIVPDEDALLAGLPGWVSYAYLLLVMILFAVVSVAYLRRVLYGDMAVLRAAAYPEVREAVDSNNLLNSSVFSNNEVTSAKFALYWSTIIGLAVVLGGIASLFLTNLVPGILWGTELRPLSGSVVALTCMGTLPSALVLSVWLNNPIRFLNVARRFRRGGYVFSDESGREEVPTNV